MSPTLPQDFKIVQGIAPTTTNGGSTSDWVSLRNANWAWIIVEAKQAVGHATAFTLNRATAVAPTGNTTLATNVQCWLNEDCVASDTLVKQADAKAVTVTNDAKSKMIVFGVDPSTLGDTYDCIAVLAADSSQATNFWSVTILLDTKYKQATPPAAITD